jgi:hypothetical protein
MNDFNETSPQDFFGMDGMYANPFVVNNLPMDLGPYSDTFNWVRMVPTLSERY